MEYLKYQKALPKLEYELIEKYQDELLKKRSKQSIFINALHIYVVIYNSIDMLIKQLNFDLVLPI